MIQIGLDMHTKDFEAHIAGPPTNTSPPTPHHLPAGMPWAAVPDPQRCPIPITSECGPTPGWVSVTYSSTCAFRCQQIRTSCKVTMVPWLKAHTVSSTLCLGITWRHAGTERSQWHCDVCQRCERLPLHCERVN